MKVSVENFRLYTFIFRLSELICVYRVKWVVPLFSQTPANEVREWLIFYRQCSFFFISLNQARRVLPLFPIVFEVYYMQKR